MKLILSLILILSLSSICFANLVNEFVNFQVYQDSKCKETADFGVGFSFATDTCITLNYRNDFVFSIKNNKVSWSQWFDNSGTDYTENCGDQPTSQPTTYPVNSCISAINNNGGLIFNPIMIPKGNFYYKIVTSSISLIQPNSVAQFFISGTGCDQDNTVATQYFINGTGVGISQSTPVTTYFCDSDNPYSMQCGSYCTFYSLPSCEISNSFYNTSTEIVDSSDSSVEPYCLSGSNSGSQSCIPSGTSGSGASSGVSGGNSGTGEYATLSYNNDNGGRGYVFPVIPTTTPTPPRQFYQANFCT